MTRNDSLRILAVSALTQGANDYAFVRSFTRAGHSVRAISQVESRPDWRTLEMRVARRLLQRQIIRDFNRRIVEEARVHRAELFFVFKGNMLMAETLRALRKMNCVSIQFFPDISVFSHGAWLPDAIKEYDWVFTTKSFGPGDLKNELGVHNASFLPHGYDPETHKPVERTEADAAFFGADVSFVGNWSPKKESLLLHAKRALPEARFAVWGPGAWSRQPELYRGQPVLGREYAKAIAHASITLAPLRERMDRASSGDLITSRTFHIPAVGGFMLHERNDEVMKYFDDGKECALYSDASELVTKIRHFLEHREEREAIARAGHQRALASGYSVDDRVRVILEKYRELRAS